jgi:hypothetical protein
MSRLRYGRSLREIFANSSLSLDHDDGVGFGLNDFANLPTQVVADLGAYGHNVSRNSTDVISSCRDVRFIYIFARAAFSPWPRSRRMPKVSNC